MASTVLFDGLEDARVHLVRHAPRLAYLRLVDVTVAGSDADLGRFEWTAAELAEWAGEERVEAADGPNELRDGLVAAALRWLRQLAEGATHGEARRRFKVLLHGGGGTYLGLYRFAAWTLGSEEQREAPPAADGPRDALGLTVQALMGHWRDTLEVTRVHTAATLTTLRKPLEEENRSLREENAKLRDRLEQLTGLVLSARIDASERVSAAEVEIAQIQERRDVAGRFIDRLGDVASVVFADKAGVDPALVRLLLVAREKHPGLLKALADPLLVEALEHQPQVGQMLERLIVQFLDAARQAKADAQANAKTDSGAPPA